MTDEQQTILTQACSLDTPLDAVVGSAFDVLLPAAGLEVRDQQRVMALHVARTLDRYVSLHGTEDPAYPNIGIEAPTGSGKSLAYLIPSAYFLARIKVNPHLARRGTHHPQIVISTSGISLQAQILNKDAKLVEKICGFEVSFGVLKGRSNYACLDRVENERYLPHKNPVIPRLVDWIDQGGTDRDRVPFAVTASEWARVSVDGHNCLGDACAFFSSCPSQNANARAMASGILVVNHSYLSIQPSQLTMDAVGVIVDEAHDLEDIARQQSEKHVSDRQIKFFKARAEKLDGQAADLICQVMRSVVRQASKILGSSQDATLQPSWHPNHYALMEDLADALELANQAYARLSGRLPQARGLIRKKMIARRVMSLRVILSGTSKNHCVYAERVFRQGRPEVRIACAALDVKLGNQLRRQPVVMTSATMRHPERTLLDVNLSDPVSVRLPSPWDLKRMGVAIIPRGPAPRENGWSSWAVAQVCKFVDAMGGGCLVLATSRSAMDAYADALRGSHDVRTQGEAGRDELLGWFAANEDSVLVGTRSLFQGVDVKGPALRGVVLDKIPFAVPSQLERALCEKIEAAGRNPFMERTVHKAADLMRQAVGRLIRSSTDRGAFLLLDSRVWTARYGPILRGAVEPFPVSTDVEDARRLWAGDSLQAVQPARTPAPRAIAAPRRRSVR